MDRLTEKTIPFRTDRCLVFPYDRNSTTAGILHFGAGNFHRAHQSVYCDDLLSMGEKEWAITGVSMRSSQVRDALEPQDFLYTLVTLGSTVSYRVIGAIRNLLVAPHEPGAVIAAVAASSTRLITTTVTEKGYFIARAGDIDFSDPAIQSDLVSLDRPRTIYGFLAAGLILRRQSGREPLTVICCDNLQGGGQLLATGVDRMLQAHCADSRSWVEHDVAFASSMVDRITPSTNERLRARVAADLGISDRCPVAAEPFGQWVIQDQFAGERPPFDRVGALFVKDIGPYERLKLRLFNAGHSVAAVLGYLAGCTNIHEVLEQSPPGVFVHHFLLAQVYPEASLPPEIAPASYIESSMSRFKSRSVPYTVRQVCSDGSQKIRQRWMPQIDEMLDHDHNSDYLAFALAAWVASVRSALGNGEFVDPESNSLSRCFESPKHPVTRHCLAAIGAGAFRFFDDGGFMTSVEMHFQAILADGIQRAVVDFLGAQPQLAGQGDQSHA
jgi:fructuronate reductase